MDNLYCIIWVGNINGINKYSNWKYSWFITKENNQQAKIAKDVAAGAVLVSAIVSSVIGLMIFIPKILAIF